MRKQYHFWPAARGFDAWDVDRLIELSRGLSVERVRLDSIHEVDTEYWFDGDAADTTTRRHRFSLDDGVTYCLSPSCRGVTSAARRVSWQ